METTFKKRPAPDSSQQSGDAQRQTAGDNNGKTTGGEQSWWEQFAGAIPEDKAGQQQWFKFFTNPWTILAGLVLLGYWWFNHTRQQEATWRQELEQLKHDVKRLQKKCRKLKKRLRNQESGSNPLGRVAMLE